MENALIPKGFEVLREGDALIIRLIWRRRWDAVLLLPVLLYSVLLFGGIEMLHFLPVPNLGPLALLVVSAVMGTCFLYFYICMRMNKTDVVISASGVKIETGPVPLGFKKEVAARDIVALAFRGPQRKRYRDHCRLICIDGSNKERVLREFKNREQAEFVEASIREILALK
jgi:hypothetical protein